LVAIPAFHCKLLVKTFLFGITQEFPWSLCHLPKNSFILQGFSLQSGLVCCEIIGVANLKVA
jgi:hypothetical protein